MDTTPQFPSGTVLIDETFEAGDAEWTAAPGSIWTIATDGDFDGNVYSQTSIDGEQLTSSGEVSWTNVIVEADIKVLDFSGQSTSYLAGLCVRFTSAENFYLVGLRSDGRVGLRVFTDGGSNIAASDADLVAEGVRYNLKVIVQGATITAFLDGTEVFSVSDTTHPVGGVGLCTVEAAAVFDNIKVTAP